jgi:hypothetical protein
LESAKKRFYNAKQVKRLGHRVLKDEITVGELNDLPADVKDAVMLYVDAYSYMLKFEETGEKYVTERLRKNYVGELVSDTKVISVSQQLVESLQELLWRCRMEMVDSSLAFLMYLQQRSMKVQSLVFSSL